MSVARPKAPAPASRRLKLFFFALLLGSSALRVLLSVFPKSAVTYNDELFYLELAQNIWLRGAAHVYAAPIRFTKILYSLLLAPFYAVGDGMLRARLISAFNALLLSSSLIPGYLLARRLLQKPWQVMVALLVLALSPNLLFSVTFMSENLHYPLLLWGFWAVYRFFAPAEQSEKPKRPALSALLLGFLAFLLYFSKESAAAFLVALLVLQLSSRAYASCGLTLAGFGVPWLLLKLTVFRSVGYTYLQQASFSHLTDASHIMYLLYASGIMLLYFLLTVLWFPVALPFSRRGKLSAQNRSFLYFSLLYVLILSVGVAYGVLLEDGYPDPCPRLHLRYFLAAAYPFLLLFLSSLEEDSEPLSLKSSLVRATGIFAALILLFVFIPKRGSLVDYPVLHFADYLKTGSLKWLWAVRLALAAFLLLALFLLMRKKKKLFASLLLIPLLVLEAAGGYAFLRSAKQEEAVTDKALVQETAVLDRTLDTLDGSVLVIAGSTHEAKLRLLNTLSDADYALALRDGLRDLLLEQYAENPGAVSLAAPCIPIPFERFALTKNYALSSADYLLTIGSWGLIDPDANEEITPAGVTSFRLYKAKDPSRLSLRDPLRYTPGETILFYGADPAYLNYLPAGFSHPESAFTWSAAGEVSLSVRPQVETPSALTAVWTWKNTIGDQPCEVYANDILVASETLSMAEPDLIFTIPPETWSDTGLLTLRFVFPEARQPGNGDPRTLAVAFESLTLEAGQ